jgi:hypothetical protein
MSFLLPTLGYASTFYRFKYFFSFLKKRQPQIIADLPHRVCKNNLLPVLLIIKDANHFPCELLDIEIFIDTKSNGKIEINKTVNKNYWEHITKIDLCSFETGWHEIDVKIVYKLKNKTYSCYNDNYRTTSHSSFPCYFADADLPQLDGYISGDMHSHSNYTDDQIEFGASLNATSEMAGALGLDVFAVTDHSYDLDDYHDNFLKNDPELKKWHSFLNHVQKINSSDTKVLIIPGEEVSVQNAKKETVHLLVYNNKKYFPGCGDSGEKWFRYYSELSINDVLESVSENSLVFASHPTDKVPSAHKLLLNRGQWDIKDAGDKKLNGIQIFNGHGNNQIEQALSFWRILLLKGYKSYLLAGNDGHGNFGRNRFISIPFVKISETYTQLFGKWRTDLFLGKNKKSIKNTIKPLKEGNFAVSNGPAVDFHILDEKKNMSKMGEETTKAVSGVIRSKSSTEFGPISKITIYRGNLDRIEEKTYLTKEFNSNNFELNFSFEIKDSQSKNYLRAEVQSAGPKGKHFAFTNPIWITGKN